MQSSNAALRFGSFPCPEEPERSRSFGASKIATVKIAKPLLLIITPIGVAMGLYEGYRLAGGLVLIMAALVGVMAVAMGSVVLTIRREAAAERTQPREPAEKDAK
jgi:hypothetical protein